MRDRGATSEPNLNQQAEQGDGTVRTGTQKANVLISAGGNMLKDGVDLAQKLIPPHDGDPESIYRWRVFLAGTVIAMAIGFAGHVALACGFLPMFFPGFASAADLKNLSQQQLVMRVESLGDAIYTMRKDQCLSQGAGNLMAAQSQDQRIREKRNAYRSISGQDYDVPPCDLFVSR